MNRNFYCIRSVWDITTPEDMIRRGYELDPREVEIAVSWLEIKDPDEAVGLRSVLELAQHGGDRRSEAAKKKKADQGNRITLKRGTSAEYYMARLKRDEPTLYAKVLSGEIKTPKAAARQAGWIHKTVTVIVDAGPQKAIEPLLKFFSKAELRKALS